MVPSQGPPFAFLITCLLPRTQKFRLSPGGTRAEGKPEQRLAVEAGVPEEDVDPEEIVRRLLAVAAERVAVVQS